MQKPSRAANPTRVILKAFLLFVILTAGFAYLSPGMSQFSPCCHIVRLVNTFPIYVLSYDSQAANQIGIKNVFDIDILFSSLVISKKTKSRQEYRVIAIGDSTTKYSAMWAEINTDHLKTCQKKTVSVYNLGYPGGSITKDLLILQEATKYEPDLIIWSFSQSALLQEPKVFANANPDRLFKLVETYKLPIVADKPSKVLSLSRQLYMQTLLNMNYGILGPALGSNNAAVTKDALANAIARSSRGHLALPVNPQSSDYLFQALEAGHTIAGRTPILLINEPVKLAIDNSKGYNYDQYSQYSALLANLSAKHGWIYLNYWDLLPPSEFRDQIHRYPEGDRQMKKELLPVILREACGV